MHRFNLRVYGILINDKKQILVADEYIRGGFYTKFPGGGLEFGEGTRDCLKRELKEELGIEAEIGDHIYTTDYFQMSAFRPEDQIISIYYFAKQLEELKVPLRSNARRKTGVNAKWHSAGSANAIGPQHSAKLHEKDVAVPEMHTEKHCIFPAER